MIIGRDASNWICITDPSSSRKHCLLTRNGNEFLLKDLESRNGTFVNGIPIRERILQHGDKIDVGDSSFLYLLREEKTAASSYGFSDLGVLSTTRLRIEEAKYLHPQKLLSDTSLTERISRGLETVLEFSRAVPSIRDAEALQQRLLESVMENIPARTSICVSLRW